MAITDYKVIAAADAASLTTLSAAAITAGWQPFGSVFSTEDNRLCQGFAKGLPNVGLNWINVTVTAALLDGAGNVPVAVGSGVDQYRIRGIRLVGGGTSFGAAGDRLISLTDGTTVWTTIANADVESAPAASLDWGNAKVPFLTGTSDTPSAAGSTIKFQYSGGTTDHGGVGSIKFNVLLEKIA